MNDFKNIDTWDDDAFEDIISRSMIALYESKIDPLMKRMSQERRLDEKYLRLIRKHGVVVPAPDRVFWNPLENGQQLTENIELPFSGAFSYGEDRFSGNPDAMESYCRIEYFRRVKKLPLSMMPIAPGIFYEVVTLFPQERGTVEGMRDYLTVNPTSGKIIPCFTKGLPRNEAIHRRMEGNGLKSELILNFGFQIVDDFQHQWRITAMSEDTKVTVGAYAENVKSLLYARTLPMTPSGRKRPILHAVRAHRRRLKEGTEIDISKFLRGTREIEMDGTLFKVDAPERLIREILEAKEK